MTENSINSPHDLNDLDVLIAGAGPVGLFLARELTRRRVRCAIIEQNVGQSEHSKALAVMPRTMEIFEIAGIVAPFVRVSTPARFATVVSHGHRLARIAFQPDECDYPYVAMVPQDVTERLLADRLRAVGGRVAYETRLIGFALAGDHVTAEVEQRGERTTLRARFLVGADGAHSTVRHELGLPFAGSAYGDSFALADVETSDTLPGDEMQLCPSEEGPLAIFPMSPTRRRIVATLERSDGAAPTLEEVRALVAARGPEGVEVTRLIWSSTFRVHRRQTAEMRAGPVFLAGDAAHIHSPFGGQGMNTGLQDAWNLAWKLVFVLRGLADDALLDSYSQERHPVARAVIAQTDFITRAMATPSGAAQFLRDHLIPLLARLPVFQHRFVGTLSELAVQYPNSPIVADAGGRVPNLRLAPDGRGDRLYSRLDDRYLLLTWGGPRDDVRRLVDDLAFRYGDALGAVRVEGPADSLRVQLVRPDAYLAYETAVGDPHTGELERVATSLRSVLDTHVHAAAAGAAR